MKPITITIDEPTERRLNYLMASWHTTKSETIRICVDEVFTDKCYNGYGLVAIQKGDEKKRNAKDQELEQKPTKLTLIKRVKNLIKRNS